MPGRNFTQGDFVAAFVYVVFRADAEGKAVEVQRVRYPGSGAPIDTLPPVAWGDVVRIEAEPAMGGQTRVIPRRRPEAPRVLKGDAAAEIATPSDQRWTDAVREAYADRVEAILARHIKGFKTSVIQRRCYSPADLEAMNINLVGGDPYGGHCGIDQFFLWRPLRSTANHATPVKRLYHIGASTHPGPGLGGGSGFLLASALT